MESMGLTTTVSGSIQIWVQGNYHHDNEKGNKQAKNWE